jgi:outer membrane protein assembly factor BamB
VAAFWAVNAIACAPTIPKPGPERQASVWPAYLGSPRHDASADETLNPDPRAIWQTDAGRAVRGSPAFGESILAVGAADRMVVLLDRATGAVHWRQRLAGSIHAGPLLDEDRLYVATEANPESQVYALRLRDGRTLWHVAATGVQAPLAFDGQAVYAAGEDGVVLRIDAETGRETWRRRLPGAVRAAPVPTSDGLAVATSADSLFVLDVASGAVRARTGTPGTILAAPVVSAGRLFAATTAGFVVELALPSLVERWTRPAGDAVFGAPALSRDTLYVAARNGTLWLIPVNAPETARAHDLDIVTLAGPTPVRSGVLVASVSGEVLLVDRVNGAILWRAQVNGPVEQPPLVRERQLVVVSGRGDIHAYR